MTKKRETIFWVLLFFISFSVLGTIAFYFVSWQVDKNFREEINFAIEVSMAAINPERVKNLANLLPGDISQTDDFKRLKDQTVKLGDALEVKGIDAVYILTKINDTTYFLVESTPLGESGYVLPGAIYEEPPQDLDIVFKTRLPITTDIYTDEYGTYISQFNPLSSFSDQKFVGVLGVDVDYAHYQETVAEAHLLILLITAFLFLFTLLVFFYFKSRKKVRLETEYSENKIRTIINTVHDAIVVTSENGVINFWNNASQEIFSLKQGDALNKKFNEIVNFSKIVNLTSSEHIKDFFSLNFDKLIDQIFEAQITNSKKQDYSLELVISTTKFGEHILIVYLFKNITERKKRENELEKMNKLMIGREVKMIELKEEIVALKGKLGFK